MVNQGAGLANRTLFITGASRGIGKAIALRAARDGANIVVAARTDQPHPKLPGTIHETVSEIEHSGGSGLALKVDVRDDASIEAAAAEAVDHFGGLDILVNNASAIFLQDSQSLSMNHFDLMCSVNVRGAYSMTRSCLPYLLKSSNPHVLNISPPLNLSPVWFRDHLGYTVSKYALSMCVVGMAEEFRNQGLAFNALWPRTVIATAAINLLAGSVAPKNCRKPEIMADAAYEILTRDSRQCSGNFFLDENVLRAAGKKDFNPYQVEPGQPLMKDLFID
jgi:citronellol/citronellal dehydrogenase